MQQWQEFSRLRANQHILNLRRPLLVVEMSFLTIFGPSASKFDDTLIKYFLEYFLYVNMLGGCLRWQPDFSYILSQPPYWTPPILPSSNKSSVVFHLRPLGQKHRLLFFFSNIQKIGFTDQKQADREEKKQLSATVWSFIPLPPTHHTYCLLSEIIVT